MNPDTEDLKEYVSRGSEEAFRRIVNRHAAMVHGVSYRFIRDRFLAEEITQSVFILLARKARAVPGGHLAGWLHRAATGESRNALRKEQRQTRLHQRYHANMNETHSPTGQWSLIEPHLDQAVGRLPKADRELVLLRYFEQRSFQEIASATGCTEEGCKKRAQRALKRLADLLGRRGVAVGGSSLATLLAFGAMQPSASAATLSSTALGAASASSASLPGIFHLIQLMTTKQITISICAIIALAAIPTYRVMSQRPDTKTSQNSPDSLGSSALPGGKTPKAASPTNRPKNATVSNHPIKWEELARAQFIRQPMNVREGNASMLMGRLKEMSDEDLTRGMDEVTALDIPIGNKLELRNLLTTELSSRDPMLVLDRLSKDKNDPKLLFAQCFAFRSLLDRDPEKAETWLTQQVAQGNLPESPIKMLEANRFSFESEFIGHQMESNPSRAFERLASYPDSEKGQLLLSAGKSQFDNAHALAMDYYQQSGSDSLINALMGDIHVVGQGVRELGVPRLLELADQIPNPEAREAARRRVEEAANMKFEAIPMDLMTE